MPSAQNSHQSHHSNRYFNIHKSSIYDFTLACLVFTSVIGSSLTLTRCKLLLFATDLFPTLGVGCLYDDDAVDSFKKAIAWVIVICLKRFESLCCVESLPPFFTVCVLFFESVSNKLPFSLPFRTNFFCDFFSAVWFSNSLELDEDFLKASRNSKEKSRSSSLVSLFSRGGEVTGCGICSGWTASLLLPNNDGDFSRTCPDVVFFNGVLIRTSFIGVLFRASVDSKSSFAGDSIVVNFCCMNLN